MAAGLKAAVYGNTQELKITDDMALPLKLFCFDLCNGS